MQWRKKLGNMKTRYDNQSIYISVSVILPSEPVVRKIIQHYELGATVFPQYLYINTF